MIQQQYPSKLLEAAVGEFAKLPGIGRKTALRLVLNLLKRDVADVDRFVSAVADVRHGIKHCAVCHNISDSDVCPICADRNRDKSTVCVVENVQDVMAIEATMQYNGLYHVLGGVISPIDGVFEENLNIDGLIRRLDGVKEVIIATNADVKGEATAFTVAKKVKAAGVKVTRLAQGISMGSEVEYADEATLSRALESRVEL